jgi:hypothetical protein
MWEASTVKASHGFTSLDEAAIGAVMADVYKLAGIEAPEAPKQQSSEKKETTGSF